MSAKYKSPSFLLPNEINTNTNPLNTDGNPATGTGVNSLYSMDFDGTEYITGGTFSEYISSTNPTTLTVSAWIKTTDTGASRGIVSSAFYSSGLNFDVYNGEVSFGVSGTAVATTTTANVNDGNWHHVVGTYDSQGDASGNTLYIYVDSVQKASNAVVTLYTRNDPLFIGAKGAGSSTYFPFIGQIDEVAIFNRALDSTEISSLWNNGSPSNLMATDLNPLAYYPLGEQAQNTGYLDPSNPGSDMSGSEWQFPNGVLQDYVMDFDGSNEINLSPVQSLTNEFSISIWVKPDVLNNLQVILGNEVSDWIRLNSAGQITFRINGNNPSSENFNAISGNNLVANVWQHLLFIRDSSDDIRIYRNGSLFSTNAYNQAAAFSVGKIGARTGVYYSGEVSNLAIWNTDQSTNKDNIYNNGSPQTTYTVTPQNWWKLNADSVYTPSVASYSTALDFDSLNSDYISIPNSSSLTNGFSELTVSIWANFSTLGTQQIISKDGATSQRSWILRKLSSGVNFLVSTDGTSASQTLFYPNANITVGRWYHFVGIYDGSKLLFYVDGVLIDDSVSLTGSLPSTTSEVFIGTYDYGNSNTFDGKLSNAAIYNSALTPSQVSTLFNFGTPETNISFSPQAWWKLDDQTAITDSSGNGNTGTNNGATNAPGGVAVVPSWKIPSALNIPTVNYTTALDFDKTQNDNVFIGSPSAIQNLTNITLSVWVKVPSTFSIPYYTVASKGEYGSSGSQWNLTVKTGNSGPGGSFAIYKTSNSTSATSVSYTTDIDDNKWHNIVCINDGTDLKVYIDGQLDATNAGNGGNIYNGNRDLKIGRLTASSIRNFDGLMSNMVIWGDRNTKNYIKRNRGYLWQHHF